MTRCRQGAFRMKVVAQDLCSGKSRRAHRLTEYVAHMSPAMHRSSAPGRSRRRLARQTRLALGLRVKQKFKNYRTSEHDVQFSPSTRKQKGLPRKTKRPNSDSSIHPIPSSFPRITRSPNAPRYCKGRVLDPRFPPPSSSPSSIPQTSPRGLVSASSARAAVAVCPWHRPFVR